MHRYTCVYLYVFIYMYLLYMYKVKYDFRYVHMYVFLYEYMDMIEAGEIIQESLNNAQVCTLVLTYVHDLM
jgi:hypothetical protein